MKKKTKADIKRFWGVPVTARLRYNHPLVKGILWYWFSLFIRNRDMRLFGTCISCPREITVDTSDCGHFIPAGDCGPELLMDPRNNNAECPHCNAWDQLHLFGYAKGLDKRYGDGTAEELLRRHREYKAALKKGLAPKDFTVKEFEDKIRHYKRLLNV